MNELMMIHGTRTVAYVYAKVQPGENVLVVSDMKKHSIGKIIANVAMERNDDVVLTFIKPRKRAEVKPLVQIA